jgi:fibronectin-binding autotransporter adhesin
LTGGIATSVVSGTPNARLLFESEAAMGGGGAGNVEIGANTFAGLRFALTSSALAKISSSSTGVLGIDLNQTNAAASTSQNIDLSGAGLNADIRIGSSNTAGANYTGTLTPFGSVYKLGGGGGNLIMGNANSLTGAGRSLDVSAAGGIVGTVTLAAANNYGNGTTLGNGGMTLASRASGAFGSGAISFVSGSTASTLRFESANQSHSNAIDISGTGTANIVPNVLTTLNGSITQAGASTLNVAGSHVLVLTQQNTGTTGLTTVSSGGLALSNMNQIADGNLNLGGGVLILDGPGWGGFAGDRSGGEGTGANQWRISTGGGGFAARGSSLTINSTGTTSSTFDTSFTLGSSALGTDGNLYANAAVILDRGAGTDTIALNATNNRTIQVAGRVVTSGGVYTNLTTSPIHEISGNITGGGAARVLVIQGVNNGNATAGTNGGILRLSGSNTFQATVKVGSDDPGSTTGYGVLIATSDAAFGDAANVVQVASSTPNPDSGWALLLEDTNGAGSTTFSRNFLFANRGGATQTRPWALGSYAGDVIYAGTVSIQDVAGQTTVAGTYGVGLHAESGSTFALGTNGGSGATLQTTYISANAHVMQLEKTGSGTLILGNVALAPSGSNSFTVQIGRGGINNTLAAPYFDGAVRETGNGSTNSLNGRLITLAGGVLESSDSAIGSAFTRSLGGTTANVRWVTGGGGFAAYGGLLTVNIGGAGAGLEWSATDFVGDNNPLIFGSETANNRVLFSNVIGLDNVDSGTFDREIRVIDNPNSAADVAEISGNIANRGNLASGGGGTRSITKTGDGTLIFSGGNNSYNGNTTVAAGTLRVNGLLDTRSSIVSVAAGATLGGNGTINRAVNVNGTLAPGNSPGILTTGNLTLGNNSTFALELNGTTPGNGAGNHDQVVVNGAITLGGGVSDRVDLTLSLGYSVAVNDVFIVLLNDGADGVNYGGSFGLFRYNGGDLTNNGTFGVGAYTFQIDYAYAGTGADGNDVALIVTAVPEPGAGLMMLAGLGFLALVRRRNGTGPRSRSAFSGRR